MSSVHAVTQNVEFKARVASFYPLDGRELTELFSQWLAEQSKQQGFLVYRVSFEQEVTDYA
jgi:hypothetical protein